MPPGTLEIALLIGQALMKYGPDVARQIQLLFTKTNPTAADWEAVFALSEKTYDQFVAPLGGTACAGPGCVIPALTTP